MVEISAVFQIVGDSPPTALTVGGMFFLLLGCIFHTVSPGSGESLIKIGGLLLLLGVLLYLIGHIE